jgi:adenosylcobinamide-GDP ribazoletransferase
LAAALVLTGGLHMDGAMDTADGLGAGERMLEAMRDSRVGASGAQALAVLLLLKAGALASLDGNAPWALVWAALWGRMAPLLAVAWFPYLHPRGSAGFHRQHWAGLQAETRPGLLAGAGLVVLGLSQGHAPLGLVGVLPALLVPGWLGRRLGGHSGDSYGACVEWTEALALTFNAAALHWPAT